MTTKVRGEDQLQATGVADGVYGDSTHVPQITVLPSGQIESVTEILISGGGGGSLAGLSDVLILYLSDGQILRYDAGLSKWVNTDLTNQVNGEVDGDFIGSSDTINLISGDGVKVIGSQSTPADPLDLTIETIIAKVKLLGQTANIATTFFDEGFENGEYRVTYYLVNTSSDLTAGSITLTIGYNDGVGARTQTSSALLLTSGGATQGQFVVRVGDDNGTSYAVGHTGIFGTSQYAVYLTLERLGLD